MSPLEIKIKLEALITEREGMIAENQICKITNDYYPYGMEAFQELTDKILELVILTRDIH
jgi:hypothetical protein